MAQHTFVCPACNGEYDAREKLEEHGRQYHAPQKAQRFQCPACGGHFETQEQLAAHGTEEHQK
ncbi:MAG: hypothetical protein HY690_12325 [Chloroflexi bacterium]|nr:hypothetical protein [Chloroflexota bacterium]